MDINKEREAFEAKYEQAKAVAFDAEHNRYVPRNDTHWQLQCAEAMTQAWRAFQAGAACVGCQAAPAGEREAFEQRWAMRAADDEGNPGAKPLRSEVEPLRYRGSAAQGSWVWFQRGAAWQRTQAAEVAVAQAKPTGVPKGWQIAPTKDGDGFIVSSPRINGVASHTAVFSNDKDPAHKLLWHMLAAPAQPAAIEVIGYASPGQVEILRSLPRTGGMKVKGRKDGRYTEPVVLLSAARAALFTAVIRCEQAGAFKTCMECGYQDGHDEICKFHGSNRAAQDPGEVQKLREAGDKLYNELRQWLATEHDPESQAALHEWRAALAARAASTGQEV